MEKLFTLLLVAWMANFPFISGQIVLPGDCPKYPTQLQFNPAQVGYILTIVWFDNCLFIYSFDTELFFNAQNILFK